MAFRDRVWLGLMLIAVFDATYAVSKWWAEGAVDREYKQMCRNTACYIEA